MWYNRPVKWQWVPLKTRKRELNMTNENKVQVPFNLDGYREYCEKYGVPTQKCVIRDKIGDKDCVRTWYKSFKCVNCGEEFHDDVCEYEQQDKWLGKTKIQCPHCGQEYIIETKVYPTNE